MVAKIRFCLLIIFSGYSIDCLNSSSFATDLQHDRYCHNSHYCKRQWSNHSLCVPSLQNVEIKECHCSPNYKFDESDKTCKLFDCKVDNECQEWDIKRVCRNRRCVCDLTYEEQPEDLYLCVHVVYEAPASLLWLWLLFVVPLMAIISVIIKQHGKTLP